MNKNFSENIINFSSLVIKRNKAFSIDQDINFISNGIVKIFRNTPVTNLYMYPFNDDNKLLDIIVLYDDNKYDLKCAFNGKLFTDQNHFKFKFIFELLLSLYTFGYTKKFDKNYDFTSLLVLSRYTNLLWPYYKIEKQDKDELIKHYELISSYRKSGNIETYINKFFSVDSSRLEYCLGSNVTEFMNKLFS